MMRFTRKSFVIIFENILKEDITKIALCNVFFQEL